MSVAARAAVAATTTVRVDVAVVGGGIVGSAVAEALLRRCGSKRVALLEKERAWGQHQSSHNSGVIHAGVYYAPSSLRARLCVDGAARLYAFAAAHRIAHRRCGKVIVAVRESELPRLAELQRRAEANGVAIEPLNGAEVQRLEPGVTRAVAGLYSPHSGVIDYAHVVHALAQSVQQHHGARGSVLLGFELQAAERDARGDCWRLSSARSSHVVEARYVVTCAGLFSDRVAQLFGAAAEPMIVPVRGEWRLMRAPHSDVVRGLIYPVPDPKFPFLGVHFTRRVDGSVLIGPNALLATAREGYSPAAVNLRDVADMAQHAGLRSLAAREFRFGVGEAVRSVSRRAHLSELAPYIPSLQLDHMTGDKLTGVRAQAMSRTGELINDFVLEHGPHCMHVRNAPSPAATASLAIAEHIVDEIEKVEKPES
jgi:L-2-hydroxyglutarate oxidase LhgO